MTCLPCTLAHSHTRILNAHFFANYAIYYTTWKEEQEGGWKFCTSVSSHRKMVNKVNAIHSIKYLYKRFHINMIYLYVGAVEFAFIKSNRIAFCCAHFLYAEGHFSHQTSISIFRRHLTLHIFFLYNVCLLVFLSVSIHGRRHSSLVILLKSVHKYISMAIRKKWRTNICKCLMECKHFWVLNKSTISNKNGEDS